jgi:protein PhnA
VVKVGTKIKNIRLVDSSDNHNIDCKIDGVGALKITPKYVKKA